MSSDWNTTRIGQQVTLQRGIDITKAHQRPGKIPVVSSGGVSSYHDTAFAKGPGVVLGRKGTVGSVFYIKDDFWPHDTSLWVRDFHGNDPRFVYYFFRSMVRQLVALDVGTANPALNRNHVHSIVVRWPPVGEQKAIGGILGALDDTIEVNREMNRTLEATAQSVFKSWFIDFDPVVAKVERRNPFAMSAQVAALFPNEFTESKLGPIPQGWGVMKLSDAFDINPRRPLRKGQGAPYLEMQAMPTDSALPERWGNRSYGSGMTYINGDTLVARITPCLENGKTAHVVALAEGEVGWGSTEYIVLRSRQPLPVEFSYFVARSDDFRSFAIASMTGSSGRQRVQTSALNGFEIVVPFEPVVRVFGHFARVVFATMQGNVEQSHTLASLRDALLPRLLSGDIRICQAEKLVEQAV